MEVLSAGAPYGKQKCTAKVLAGQSSIAAESLLDGEQQTKPTLALLERKICLYRMLVGYGSWSVLLVVFQVKLTQRHLIIPGLS